MSHAARRPLRAVAGTIALATAAATSVCGAPAGSAAPAAPDRVLRLMFNDAQLTGKTPHFTNAGSASLAVSLATRGGGSMRAAKGRLSPARNTAIRTPAFDPSVDGARAVVKVVDRVGVDQLDPGTRAFTFGADFTRNARSERAGSSDNGDNLMQRGLFGSRSQFKIQLDHRRVSCRIKGASGAVEVVSPVAITAGRWYRARCTRSGAHVTLAVSRWTESGRSITTSKSVSGSTGSLTPTSKATPLSIGGKLGAGGGILDASDQFNGRIDNAIMKIS